MKTNMPYAFMAVCLTLSGCATVSHTELPALDHSLKIVLDQSPVADPEALPRVIAPDQSKDDPRVQEKVRATVESVQHQSMSDMRADLRDQTPFSVLSSVASMPSDLAELQRTTGADLLMRFGVSDYGLTPKAWRSGVIAFEVTSTLGIAAWAYIRPATRALAGIYLAQESVEESLEAYSGFWALDEVYRPVRVKAEVLNLHTGQRVWSDSETGFSDCRLARLYTKVSEVERQTQLRDALSRAIAKLVKNFQQNVHPDAWSMPMDPPSQTGPVS